MYRVSHDEKVRTVSFFIERYGEIGVAVKRGHVEGKEENLYTFSEAHGPKG